MHPKATKQRTKYNFVPEKSSTTASPPKRPKPQKKQKPQKPPNHISPNPQTSSIMPTVGITLKFAENNKPQGKGTMYFKDGTIMYANSWRNGRPMATEATISETVKCTPAC